jgi:hypothetical protein
MNRQQRALVTTEQGERTWRKVYETILEYCAEYGGNFPTHRDLCDLCDIGSTSTVAYHIDALIEEGLIERVDYRLVVVGAKWIPPSNFQISESSPVSNRTPIQNHTSA